MSGCLLRVATLGDEKVRGHGGLTPKPVKCACRMEMGGQPGSDVHKLPNTLDSCSLVEITSSDRFPVTRNKPLRRPHDREVACLITSKSVPAEMSSIFWNFMISSSCTRTSRAFRKSLGCKKWRTHHSSLYLCRSEGWVCPCSHLRFWPDSPTALPLVEDIQES